MSNIPKTIFISLTENKENIMMDLKNIEKIYNILSVNFFDQMKNEKI